VSTLPGGGAEVFSPAARATIADRKLTGDEWLAVHREAHSSACRRIGTMLYGHVETPRGPRGPSAGAPRPPGRDRRIPHIYPASLPSRPQCWARPWDARERPPPGSKTSKTSPWTAAARQHPTREDPLADGDAVYLPGVPHVRMRRPRGNGPCSSASITKRRAPRRCGCRTTRS